MARKWIGTLPTLLWIVLAASLSAYWLNRLLAPRPLAALTAPLAVDAPRLADALKPFAAGGDGGSGGENAVHDVDGLRLTGVYAGEPGFATFRLAGRDLAARAGQDILPGLRLLAVAPDHVRLTVQGKERRLDLPTPPALNLAGPVTEAKRP